jgi:hypothetical protein
LRNYNLDLNWLSLQAGIQGVYIGSKDLESKLKTIPTQNGKESGAKSGRKSRNPDLELGLKN